MTPLDTLPLWFLIPAAVALWSLVLWSWVRDS